MALTLKQISRNANAARKDIVKTVKAAQSSLQKQRARSSGPSPSAPIMTLGEVSNCLGIRD